MIREISWPVWLLIIGLFITFFVIIGVGIHSIKSNASHEEQVIVEVNSEEIESGIMLQTETKEADDYTSFIAYPFFSIEEIDTKIKKWVDEQEKIFHEEVVSSSDILNEEITAHFNIQTNINKVNKNMISIHLNVEHFVEKDIVFSYVKTLTVDRKNEEIVPLTDVFIKEALDGDALNNLIGSKLKEIDNTYKDLLNNVYHEDFNWYIDDGEIIFFFNPKVLQNNDTVVQITLTITEIHQYLTDTYKDILITEEIANEIEQLKKAETQKPRKLKKGGKYVALTFDDGPNEYVTPRILATLKEYDAKATFYMLSKNVENNPELALEVAYDGHEIANHSNTHVNLNAVNASRIKDEVINSMNRIEKAIGIKPETFRPPYGEYNNTVIKYAEESDQYVINWSVDSLDWQSRNAKSIYKIVVNHTRPGAIILFHDIHEPTADALPKIMKYLSEQDYEFVTVSELLPLLEENGAGPYFGH